MLSTSFLMLTMVSAVAATPIGNEIEKDLEVALAAEAVKISGEQSPKSLSGVNKSQIAIDHALGFIEGDEVEKVKSDVVYCANSVATNGAPLDLTEIHKHGRKLNLNLSECHDFSQASILPGASEDPDVQTSLEGYDVYSLLRTCPAVTGKTFRSTYQQACERACNQVDECGTWMIGRHTWVCVLIGKSHTETIFQRRCNVETGSKLLRSRAQCHTMVTTDAELLCNNVIYHPLIATTKAPAFRIEEEILRRLTEHKTSFDSSAEESDEDKLSTATASVFQNTAIIIGIVVLLVAAVMAVGYKARGSFQGSNNKLEGNVNIPNAAFGESHEPKHVDTATPNVIAEAVDPYETLNEFCEDARNEHTPLPEIVA